MDKVKKAVEYGTGTVAAGGAAVNPDAYGNYLVSHGLLALSYAELIQVIGCAYVLVLLFKLIGGFRLTKWVYSKIENHIHANILKLEK